MTIRADYVAGSSLAVGGGEPFFSPMSGADTISASRGASYAGSLEYVPVVCLCCVQMAFHFPDLPCLSHLDCSVGDRDTMFVDSQTSTGVVAYDLAMETPCEGCFKSGRHV